MRYLITFSCYGAHLHGDEPGSVDREHNLPGGRYVDFDPQRLSWVRASMDQEPYLLDQIRRETVLVAVEKHCLLRGWNLLAAHARTNHVHVVVESDVPPERMLNEIKSYASRALNLLRCDELGRKRWARHGSTRWLWNDREVGAAIKYVVESQGEPMAVFVAQGL